MMMSYRRRPTRHLYCDGSLSSSPSERVSNWFYSIRILVGFAPIIPASLSISRVYLHGNNNTLLGVSNFNSKEVLKMA